MINQSGNDSHNLWIRKQLANMIKKKKKKTAHFLFQKVPKEQMGLEA